MVISVEAVSFIPFLITLPCCCLCHKRNEINQAGRITHNKSLPRPAGASLHYRGRLCILIPYTDWAHNAHSVPFEQSKNAHSVSSLYGVQFGRGVSIPDNIKQLLSII